MYFDGDCVCFNCGLKETLSAKLVSGWRAIKAEKKLYFICVRCLPASKADGEVWKKFYRDIIEKIYKKDFSRPIKSLMLMIDTSGNPQIMSLRK